jgi:calcineurin-like phosphoesterase family protein
MIWFTSDWHIGHKNIIEYCKRPFRGVEEMDRTILDNFFSMVKKGDTVYYLGDLSFHVEPIKNILMHIAMAGIKFYYIIGNHDNYSAAKRFVYIQFHESVYDLMDIDIEGQPVTLCHYPMLTFNKSHFGAWQLFGHHHNGGFHKNIPPAVMGKKLNVGVDIHDFCPVPWDSVKEYMSKQPNNFDFLTSEKRNHK